MRCVFWLHAAEAMTVARSVYEYPEIRLNPTPDLVVMA